MKNYSVRMIREDMENIPQFPIPKGFGHAELPSA